MFLLNHHENIESASASRKARVRYDSFKNVSLNSPNSRSKLMKVRCLSTKGKGSSHHVSRKPGKLKSIFRFVFTCNKWWTGMGQGKIKPQKKIRTSLNNSDVNSFIQSRDNARQSNANLGILSINTQQQTPNMEKRELEREGSVSSEEEKKVSNRSPEPLYKDNQNQMVISPLDHHLERNDIKRETTTEAWRQPKWGR